MAEHVDVDDTTVSGFKFMNEAFIATGNSMAERLDENFWFLMSLAEKDVKDLSDHMRAVVSKWFMHLAEYADGVNVDRMAQRNFYLGQLIDCIQEKRFGWPFNTFPSKDGELPALPGQDALQNLDDATESPEWLKQALKQAEENQNRPRAKNFETYLSTKLFDNERGACAYIAVSATNEGDTAAWVRLKTNEKREKELEEVFEREIGEIEQAMQKTLIETAASSSADSFDLGSGYE